MDRVETKDLYCGAYILASGGTLEELSTAGGKKGRPFITFVFTGGAVKELLQVYRSGKAVINLADYKVALSHLKDVMFEHLRMKEEKESSAYGTGKTV